jgi:hypothetical protein
VLQTIDALAVHGNLSSWSGDTSTGYQLFFSFEYAILSCMAFSSAVKYILSIIDAGLEHRWPSKGLYTLYLELFMDVIHFFLYSAFFISVMHSYKIVPFHLVFDVFSAYRSLFRCATNYLRYRSVMAKINTLAVATEEDVTHVGRTCIICRDEMALAEGLKKLACGHVFHLSCLQSWLERQQTCPICRSGIFQAPAARPTAAAAAVAPHVAAAQPRAVAGAEPLWPGQAAGAAPAAAAAMPAGAARGVRGRLGQRGVGTVPERGDPTLLPQPAVAAANGGAMHGTAASYLPPGMPMPGLGGGYYAMPRQPNLYTTPHIVRRPVLSVVCSR